LDLQPDGDYQAIFDKLDELMEKDFLGFETCDSRIEGSFDDLPDEDDYKKLLPKPIITC